MAEKLYTLDLDGFKALARDHRRLEHEVENLKRLLSHVNVEAAPIAAMVVKPDDVVPAMSSTGGFNEGDATLYRPVRGGGPIGAGSALDSDTLYDAGSKQKVINLSQSPLSSNGYYLGVRDGLTGRVMAGGAMGVEVEFGEADAKIAAATSANSTSGVMSLFALGTTGGVVDTGNNITLVNLTEGAIPSDDQTVAWFHAPSNSWITARPNIVEIGKADGTISAASTAAGGAPGSGTVSIWTFTSTGGTTDTGINVTAYNFSVDTVASGKWLQLVRHHRSANWLVNYEDCGTT